MPDDDAKPVFSELRDVLMPPGDYDKNAAWRALRDASRQGGIMHPGGRAPDVSLGAHQVPDAVKRALPPGGMPADPFGRADDAGIALGEMYSSMLAGGIPLDSVERILGHMLASLPAPGGGTGTSS